MISISGQTSLADDISGGNWIGHQDPMFSGVNTTEDSPQFDMGSDFGNFGNQDNWVSSGSFGDSPNMLGDYTNWGGDYNSYGGTGDASFSSPTYGNFSNFSGSEDSSLERFAKNPVVSFLMGLHPITAGANALMRGPSSTGGFLGSLVGGAAAGPLGSFFGRGIGQGAGSLLSGQPVTTSSFLPTGSQTGGFLGSLFGAQTGNPYMATLGGMLGSKIGGAVGSDGSSLPSSATPGINGMGSNLPTNSMGVGGNFGGNMVNDSLAGLLPSYLATNAAQKATKGQISNLEQLFAPNSAYAQNMRQQLDRRDAAAGRRSQYGPREVELQAKLATLAAAQAPQIQKLYDQRNANRNMLINTALRNPGVQKLMTQGINGLAGLFSSPAAPSLGGTTFNPDLENMPNYLETIPWGDTGGGW